MNLMFKPFGVISGMAAGRLAGTVFDRAWSKIDGDDPPAPSDRRVALARLVLALALEGAVFSVARGLAEHGARHGFAAMTGEWPE